MSPGTTPKARLAHSAVAFAIKAGELCKQRCEVCGEKDTAVAHHDDYNKPLSVRRLCHGHHSQLQASLRPRLTDRLLTYRGETLSIADWAKRVGLNPSTLYGRIFLMDWPVAVALCFRPCSYSPEKEGGVLSALCDSVLVSSSARSAKHRPRILCWCWVRTRSLSISEAML